MDPYHAVWLEKIANIWAKERIYGEEFLCTTPPPLKKLENSSSK